ncbi:MAG: hypothetical protein EA360_08700 [Balneolaceae bacterium]|nr:MAG: hypothetical protein EA360_08700 [Balneolaceae bacterium]
MSNKLTEKKKKRVIGRIEKITLPDLSGFSLDAKIDTGAYTSSLHCHQIELFRLKNRSMVRFLLLDPDHPEYLDKPFECPVFKIKKIRSSNGTVTERVIIKQKAVFYGESGHIQLSLANRSEMRFPVLIGRRFITGKYLVDVTGKYFYKPDSI